MYDTSHTTIQTCAAVGLIGLFCRSHLGLCKSYFSSLHGFLWCNTQTHSTSELNSLPYQLGHKWSCKMHFLSRACAQVTEANPHLCCSDVAQCLLETTALFFAVCLVLYKAHMQSVHACKATDTSQRLWRHKMHQFQVAHTSDHSTVIVPLPAPLRSSPSQ